MNVLDELKERGYFEQATYEDELRELLENEKVKFYIGFDATADSLTIGHFIQIMVMMRMQKHGHILIVLLGGDTLSYRLTCFVSTIYYSDRKSVV